MSSQKPLPLGETLRDLALLRASDVELSSLLPPPKESQTSSHIAKNVDDSWQNSYEFVKEARAVMRILNRGDIEKQAGRLEDVRAQLEDLIKGLDTVPESR